MKLSAEVSVVTVMTLLISCKAWCDELTVNPATDISGWKHVTDTGDTSGTTWSLCEGPNKRKALQIDYFFRNTDPKAPPSPTFNMAYGGAEARDQLYLIGPLTLDVSPYSWFSIWIKGSGVKISGSGQYFLSVDFVDGSGKLWRMGAFSVADNKWRRYECSFNAPSRIESDPGFNRRDVRSMRLYLDEAGAGSTRLGTGSIAVGPITLSNDDRRRLLNGNLARLAEWTREFDLPSRSAVSLLSSQWKSGLDLTAAEGKALILKNRVLREAASAITGLPESAVRYCVGMEKPIVKLPPDPYRFTGDVSGTMRLSAAGHEYESGKLVFLPLGQEVKGITVKMAGDLVGPKEKRIPASALDVRLGSFVNTTTTTFAYYDYVGEMEDPILKNAPFDLAPNRVQPVWVTVHVPAGTLKGSYRGEIQVTAANAPPWSIHLVVDVKGFDLPVEHHVARHFYYWPDHISKWYGYPSGWFGPGGPPEEVVKRHAAMLLSYRIDPVTMFMQSANPWTPGGEPLWPLKVKDGKSDFTKFDEILAFCKERGMSWLCIGDLPRQPLSTHPNWPAAKDYLSQLLTHLKETGWFEKSSVKLADEPGPTFNWIIEDQAKALHAVDPKLKTLACSPDTHPGLGKYVNIWLPRLPDFTPEDAEMMRAEGAEIGWYVCCIPFHHPEVNYWINYPGLDQRILEWMNWKLGIKHTLFWAVNDWDPNHKKPGEKKWPDIPWNAHSYSDFNGDGNLTYPSPDGDLLASVRLELIRDGAEDYEYFYILDDLARRIQAKGLSDSFVKKARRALRLDAIVTDPRNYERDPGKLMAYRDHVGSLIEQGRRILGT